MLDTIKQLKALQLTRIFMCNLLNLADCVKETPKTFEITHFLFHSLAYGAFSGPKQTRQLELCIKLKTLKNTRKFTY